MTARTAPSPLRLTRWVLNRSLGWHAASAPRLAEVRDLAIVTAKQTLAARLYVPAGSQDRPLVIYFHGGGFVFSGLETHEALCRWLAQASCLRILAISYRLAPEAQFPAQIDDATAAVDWVLSNHSLLGGLDRRVVLAGDSAGAYLAASAALALHREQPGTVVAQLLMSPLVHVDDVAWAAETFRSFRWIGRIAVAYIRHALGGEPLLALAAASGPPAIIVYGGRLDPVRADALELAAALRRTGTPVETYDHPWLIHGGLNLTRTSRLARDALVQAGAALSRLVDA